MDTLKFIVLIENLLGIYRNFSWFGKYQNLVFYRILFEISVQIASLVFYLKCTENIDVIQFYYTVSFLNSLFTICLSVYRSNEFIKITKQHKYFNSFFPTDEIYKQKYNSRKKGVFYVMLVYNLYCLSSYSVYYLQLSVDEIFKCPDNVYYLIELSVYLSDLRFLIELPIISVFYLAMMDQLDAISRSLQTEINNVKRFKTEYRYDDAFYSRFSKSGMFDHWTAAYTIVDENSKLYVKVFGFQITASVISMIIYYVLGLYGVVFFSIMGNFDTVMLFMFIFTLAAFITVLFMLSRAAQRANNSANTMRRQLCMLLVHSLECNKQYKATRDILRLVRTHPIQTRAFGAIDVDITLLPTCIAFCISYTIIALQFNNVL